MADHNIDFPVSQSFARHFDGVSRDAGGDELATQSPAVVTLDFAFDLDIAVVTFLIPAQEARDNPDICKEILKRRTDMMIAQCGVVPAGVYEYWHVGGHRSFLVVECRVACIEL